MKDFNDFLASLEEHNNELQYDIADPLKNTCEPGFSLSQADMTFIVWLQQAHMISLLRQYHVWLNREDGC